MSGWSVIETASRPTTFERSSSRQSLDASTVMPRRSVVVVMTSSSAHRPTRGRGQGPGTRAKGPGLPAGPLRVRTAESGGLGGAALVDDPERHQDGHQTG